MDVNFQKHLESVISEGSILYDEPMKLHTTFKIGGPADIFVTPGSAGELAQAVRCCSDMHMPYYIIGNGSNLLVGDKGYRGVIFQLYHTMDEIHFEQEADGGVCVRAGAGVMLSKLAKAAAEQGLGGFEFAAGIPGTFGGAVTMNAGAYGGEMKSCLLSASVMDKAGHQFTLKADELKLGYRTSIIQTEAYTVLEAVLLLKPGRREEIQKKICELNEQRKTKQPLEYPSAGSTFKRPEGYFAGKLIQDAGLKGYCIGGACVSEKHSGFVINKGEATAQDVLQLIQYIQKQVKDVFGVVLEPEVRMIGEF